MVFRKCLDGDIVDTFIPSAVLFSADIIIIIIRRFHVIGEDRRFCFTVAVEASEVVKPKDG